jgi:predicted alpha/beta-hydrolase family hydrolase
VISNITTPIYLVKGSADSFGFEEHIFFIAGFAQSVCVWMLADDERILSRSTCDLGREVCLKETLLEL